MEIEKSQIILFDGVCNLCNRLVQFVIKRDPQKNFQFAALQSEIGIKLLTKFELSTTDLNTLVLIKEDKCVTKSTAALFILKEIKGLWRISYAFIVVPRQFRDFVYNIIANNRYKILGKKNSCLIPSKEISDRFLI